MQAHFVNKVYSAFSTITFNKTSIKIEGSLFGVNTLKQLVIDIPLYWHDRHIRWAKPTSYKTLEPISDFFIHNEAPYYPHSQTIC